MRFDREEFETAPVCDENLTTALIYSKKIGCLISGCLGRVIIWQSDGSVGWISPPVSKNMAVSHLALLEPTDDPRPFYYLWVAYQEKSFEAAPVLRMYALLIERNYCDDKETNLHFKIDSEPSLKFELQLERVDRITGLASIERTSNAEQSEANSKKGEESLLLVGVSGKMLLFDLNQWYKDQMPRKIRDCQNPNIFLSSYQMKSLELQNLADEAILSCAYVYSTLREFPSNGNSALEELFYPRSLCLDWVELTNSRLRVWMTRGLQRELLREMAIAGPSILIQPSETFHRCLATGLVPFNADCSFDCDQNTQRDMLLSLCLEQQWASFLIKCAREWGDGSVSYLFPMFLKWGAQRASSLKIVADQLCIPLFDQSGSTIGDTEIKLLRFCSQQLECLSNVVARLSIKTNDLVRQERALRRVATYLCVLLWFYDVGLLPESHEMNADTLPITFSLQIPYPYERLAAIYRNKREQVKMDSKDSEELFIDELMTQECQVLRSQWERESGDINNGGYYPPPSLQSLLRSYLLDCHSENGSNEMENKHQITIYLLMDLVKLLQGSCPDVDQLIKYPSAFKMSPSLIKLTQAFWLLDHGDFQGFLDTLTGQLVSDSDVKDWHHKLAIRTLMRNNKYKLALTYLRVRKPPLSAIGDQSTSISLSVGCGLVQTAFHQRPQSHYKQLLSSFFKACKTCGKLNEILQLTLDPEEEEAFVKFLEENKLEETRVLYYLQRCRYTEAGSLLKSDMKNVYSAPLTILTAYNATLPRITRELSSHLNKKHSEGTMKSKSPRPMSHKRSTDESRGVFEFVLKKVRETYVRENGCQVPFISAPCMSLKFRNDKNNSGCVQFPVLEPKAPGKRTLDQMMDDQFQQQRDFDDNKRRKLSMGMDTLDKSDSRTLEASVAFETPLVQRKRPTSDQVHRDTETPHSILKTRPSIHGSKSPITLTRPLIGQQNENSVKQQEKKLARQIRFSIGQPMNDSVQEKAEEEVEDEEEAAINTSNETDRDNASEESEVFYSPNVSGKSHSTDSSYSASSIRGPRPRPGLRRSANLSSNESLTDLFRRKELKSTPLRNPRRQSALVDSSLQSLTAESAALLEVPERSDTPARCSSSPISRYSLSNESRYSSRVLPSDSSFLSNVGDNSVAEHNGTELHKQREHFNRQFQTSSDTYNLAKDFYQKFDDRKFVSTIETTSKSISITRSILTKTTITEELSDTTEDEEVVVEVDDFGLDHEPEVCFANGKEHPHKHREENKGLNEKLGESTEPDKRADECEEGVQSVWKTGEEKQSRNELVNREDRESVHSSQGLYHGSQASSDEVEQQGEISDVMDDYEAELSALKEVDDEEENAESFQSLTNSAASVRESPSNKISTNNRLGNESLISGAGGDLRILLQRYAAENSNITEDESSNDIAEVNLKMSDKSQSEYKQKLTAIYDSAGTIKEFTVAVQSKQMNESNFTEDESVGSSIEHFELIADDSEPDEDTNRECLPPPMTDHVDDARESRDNQALYTSSENTPIISESGSIVSTVSITDVTLSSDPASTRNSPKNNSRREGKVSGKKSRQESKSPTPIRMTRARSASSVSMESLTTVGTEKENTAAMERPESSAEIAEIGDTISFELESRSGTVRPRRGNRKSADREITSSSLTNMKAEVPLRRSSRRAASVQREMPTIPEISHDNVKDYKGASISETDLTKGSESTSRKPQRSRKASLTSQDTDATTPARSRRSSSVVKESVPADSQNENRITTRKRGSSVPKEITEISRTRRASSLAKDSISESTTKSPVVTKKTKSSGLVENSGEFDINSPAKNTRSRRLFSQSILEEQEEEEKEEATSSLPARGRSSSNASESEKASKRGKARERRAASLEPSKSEMKRKGRSTLERSVLTGETIKEESPEEETERRSKLKKKSTGRKRTESTTSSPDEQGGEKVRGRRRTSRSESRDSDVFLFSQPEITTDAPTGNQGKRRFIFVKNSELLHIRKF